MNFLFAAILYVVSTIMVFAIWSVVTGRRRKGRGKPQEKRKPDAGAQDRKDDAGGRWGVGKDAYCYPSINDVMGFEFVSVVKVDKSLAPAGEKQPKEEPRRSWEESQGIGTKRVSVTAVENGEDAERMRREIEEGNNIDSFMMEQGSGSAEDHDDGAEAMTKETDVSAKDLDDLSRSVEWKTGGWSNRDWDEVMSDQEFADLVDNHPDMIEEQKKDEENLRIAREAEALARYAELQQGLIERDEQSVRAFTEGILDELEEGDSETESDFEAEIREDDLPEIT